MNVLFNTYPIAFQTPGGGEIQLLKTKEALELHGCNVSLYDQWNPKLNSVDVVHFFSVFGGSQVFCDSVKRFNLPLVISSVLFPHENLSQYPMDEIKRLLDLADIVLPNSMIEAKLLSSTFDISLDKFSIVYNGVDDSFIINSSVDEYLFRNKFNISGDFLLCVGNIEPRKNQLALVNAVSSLNIEVVLLGHIRDKNYFDLIMQASNGRFKYLGYIENSSLLLKSAYKACSAFILPSFLETPGLAALEAGAMGAKVIITKIGSTTEYFLDYVNYLDPNLPENFFHIICDALSKPKNNLLKNHIVSNFTWTNAAQQTVKAYNKVV